MACSCALLSDVVLKQVELGLLVAAMLPKYPALQLHPEGTLRPCEPTGQGAGAQVVPV